ncbi:MAG: hypothetical protein IH914_06960 [candidate division Zixibacteria bacterium]|nr:hypothetical protein [candidate division Zixibacteria bacterium]
METNIARNLLTNIRDEILNDQGTARTDEFSSLRAVDAKVREVQMILAEVPTSGFSKTMESMQSDADFTANSRRVRLEALGNYVKSALRLLGSGAITSKKQITRAPDVSSITICMPGLKEVIDDRWLECQKCQHVGAFLSSVIMMGSVLEGLLLARASLDMPEACRSSKAPSDNRGGVRAIQDWNLNSLIDVAVDVGWLKTDRGKFSHALRESRNVVHPWVQLTQKAEFDLATCKTCWEVLTASVSDLLKSIR